MPEGKTGALHCATRTHREGVKSDLEAPNLQVFGLDVTVSPSSTQFRTVTGNRLASEGPEPKGLTHLLPHCGWFLGRVLVPRRMQPRVNSSSLVLRDNPRDLV